MRKTRRNTNGITMMNYTNEKARKLIQADDNLQDCHNEDKWVVGETSKGLPYLEITLQSGDKLRVYPPDNHKKYKVQFLSNGRWSVKVKAFHSLQESKDKILQWYTKG